MQTPTLSKITIAAAILCLPPAASAAEQDERWQVSAGAGLASIPEYPGSGSRRELAVPVISATYGRFFLGADPGGGGVAGAGFDFYRGGSWRFGVSLYADPTERDESDDPRLRGLGDVDPALRAGLFAVYGAERYLLRAGIGTDVSDNEQGTLARFDALARFRPSERLTLLAGPGLTWADSEYTRSFFGVSAAQSARSGLPQYEAGSGVNSARLTLAATYHVDRNWTVGGNLTAASLRGDAEDSPVTEDKTQAYAFVFASYRF